MYKVLILYSAAMLYRVIPRHTASYSVIQRNGGGYAFATDLRYRPPLTIRITYRR